MSTTHLTMHATDTPNWYKRRASRHPIRRRSGRTQWPQQPQPGEEVRRLQWAGADALELLAALLDAPAPPLRVVGAYRSTEVGPRDALARALAGLADRALVAHRALDPLAPEEVERRLAAPERVELARPRPCRRAPGGRIVPPRAHGRVVGVGEGAAVGVPEGVVLAAGVGVVERLGVLDRCGVGVAAPPPVMSAGSAGAPEVR